MQSALTSGSLNTGPHRRREEEKMRKRIVLSSKEVEEFYEDREGLTCEDFGTFYDCWLNKDGDYTVADGECGFCKRITDFAREIGITRGGDEEIVFEIAKAYR